MRKYLFLICISVSIWCKGYTQFLGGMPLGVERTEAVLNLPKQFNKVVRNTETELIYDDDSEGSIWLYFKNNQLYKIRKIEKVYRSGTSNINSINNKIEEIYLNRLEEWGEPTYVGESNFRWINSIYKSSFKYSIHETLRSVILNSNQREYYGSIESTIELIQDVNTIIASNQNLHRSSGSGFVITSNGVIVTNYHVVDGAKGIDVLINRGGEVKTYKAKVVISDKTNDISLLKIDDTTFTRFATLPYAVNARILDVGASVFALGYPMSDILGEEIKLTDGLISSKTGYQGDIVTYQISAPIQPGNSGGPLFDQNGNIVGITNAGVPDAQNVGYAIKASYLKNLVDVAPETITLPTQNTISGLSFTEKIKRLTPYVVLIKVY